MKKLTTVGIVFLLALLSGACKKDGTNTPSTDPVTGTWKVSSFVNDNIDLTSQFADYTFICNSNGTMTIQGSGYNYNCEWNWNDDNHSMCHFHIMGCDDNSILWQCDDDWDLTSHDANNCHFTNHNPNHHSKMDWTRK